MKKPNPVNDFSYLTQKEIGSTVWSLINGEGKIRAISAHSPDSSLTSFTVAFDHFTVEYLLDGRTSDIDKNPDLFRTMPYVSAPRPKEKKSFERFIVWYLDTESISFNVRSEMFPTERDAKEWLERNISPKEFSLEVLDVQHVKREFLI